MKCSKCGYISFDHNQVCPKCNKDISADQEKLNLPSYRPTPPSLLGALTGEADDSNLDIDIGTSAGITTDDQVMAMETDPSGGILKQEMALDESGEIDISLEPETGEQPAVGDDLALSLDESETGPQGDLELDMEESIADLSLDDEEVAVDAAAFKEEEPAVSPDSEVGSDTAGDLSLDLGDLSLDEPEMGKEPPSAVDEEEGVADLSELSLDEEEEGAADLSELSLDEEEESAVDFSDLEDEEDDSINLDSIALDEGEDDIDGDVTQPAPSVSQADDGDEMVLNLDDLKINETGELEIGQSEPSADTPQEAGEETNEDELSLDELSLEEDLEIDLPDDEKEVSLDLDEIDLDEDIEEAVGLDSEEISLDLEEIDLELEEDETEKK
jgi:hypothetical protein